MLLIFPINQIELSSCFYTKGLELSFNIQKQGWISFPDCRTCTLSRRYKLREKKIVALRSSSHTPEASFQNPLESTDVLNKVCLARKTRQKKLPRE
jgi:hypothetical protein